MSCCEKIKIDRLKDISHATILAQQTAGLLNRTQAVVKKTHPKYGDYYEGMDYDQAKRDNIKVLRKCIPL